MLKIVLGILVALVGLIAIVIAIGYSLPVKHVASRAISLRQKPDAIFELIANFKDASWRPNVKQVEVLAPTGGKPRFREVTSDGSITYEVAQSTSPSRLATVIADKTLPFGGAWIYEITPTADGCRLNITERGEVYSPVFRFVSRFFLGYQSSLNTYLTNVARKFGETPAIENGVAGSL